MFMMRQANYHAHYIDLDFMVRPKKRRLITFLRTTTAFGNGGGKRT